MPDRGARQEARYADPYEQAALRAWLSLNAGSIHPTAITSVKEQHSPERKSGVYRLHGALPNRSAVVAKRCMRETAAIERRIHELVLPSLPLSRIDFFGACEDDLDDSRTWLFMQDVGDTKVNADQTAAVARWLAVLHTAAADSEAVRAANLPDRGLAHYRQHMNRSRLELRALWTEWAAPDRAGARALLEQALGLFDRLDARWAAFARLADVMPPTLAHGDFARKNMRLADRPGEPAVHVFDWEMAGWGIPAVDLARLSRYGSSTLAVYASVVRSRWPTIDAAAVEQARRVGIVMWCIAAIDWECCKQRANQDRHMEDLAALVFRLRHALDPDKGLSLS